MAAVPRRGFVGIQFFCCLACAKIPPECHIFSTRLSFGSHPTATTATTRPGKLSHPTGGNTPFGSFKNHCPTEGKMQTLHLKNYATGA